MWINEKGNYSQLPMLLLTTLPLTLSLSYTCTFFHFPLKTSPFRYVRVLRFHTHPLLLVPEQQFAAGFIKLQPVDLGVVADGSQIVALN